MLHMNHAVTGLIAGVYVAWLLDHAPLPVRLLVVPVSGGAALVPDLDHVSSKIARSVGPVTKLISRVVNELSLQIYHATRGERDDGGRKDGHRTFTHTIPGCVVPGALVAAAIIFGPFAAESMGLPRSAGVLFAAGLLAICCGLLAYSLPHIGVTFTIGAAFVSWYVMVNYPAWWWLWPTVVTVGCVAHVTGDAFTDRGVPLTFPFEVDGRRWERVTFPATFDTGSPFETEILSRVLPVALVVSIGLATGILPGVVRWARLVHGG